MAFLHSAQLLVYDCGFPRWSVFFTLPNAIFFYFLFNNFYNQAYAGDKPKKQGNGVVKDSESNKNGVKHEIIENNVNNNNEIDNNVKEKDL